MKQLQHILLLIFLLSIFSTAFSQSRDYPKVTQNGKDFYLYEVKKNDGLYRISRKFKVSQEEILKYNQHAIAGISKGIKLMIPIQEPKFTATGPANNLTSHIVKSGETLYSIAQRYNVSANEIWDLNAESRNGIKAGMSLTIPAPKEKSSTSIASQRTSSLDTHTVLPKETLYSLSKKYKITIKELKKLNPELSNGLKIGQVIRISSNNVVPEKASSFRVETPIKTNLGTSIQPSAIHKLNTTEKTIIKVALLMPFMLENTNKQDATIDKFIEFYEGVLLAVDQLKEENISIELITYDTEKTPEKIRDVLKANYTTLKKVDLIIGPAYSNQVNVVSEFAQANYIPLIVPFSPRIKSIDTNPFLFQNNTPHNKQFVEASRLFIKEFSNKNIIIIDFNNDTEDAGSEFVLFLKVFLERENIPFKEIRFTVENYANIKYSMKDSIENIVVFSTEKSNIIRDLLPKMKAINTATTPISVFGFSAWNKTIKTYPSTYYYSSFFVDRKSKFNGVYRNKFRQEFGYPSYTTTPRFDLLGYDITHYFVSAISNYGKLFISTLDNHQQTQALQSKFKFVKQTEGGFLNTGVQLIHYTDKDDFVAVE